MRKCDACGYLVLGEAEACKHCGAALPQPVAVASVPAPTPSAPAPAPPSFTAPPPPPPPLPPADPPVHDAGELAYDARWQPTVFAPVPPPADTPATRTRTLPRGVLVALVFVVVGILVTSLARQVAGDPLPAGTSEFAHGRGVTFDAPNGTFTVHFPTTPDVSEQRVAAGPFTLPLTLATVEENDYELVAASLVSPVSVSDTEMHSLLHDVLARAVNGQGGSVASEHDAVVSGLHGIEINGRAADGYHLHFVALARGDHLYLLGAHSKHATQKLYDALVASFVAT